MERPDRLRALVGHLAAAAEPTEREAELARSTAQFRAHGVAFIPGLVGPTALAAMHAALRAEPEAAAQPSGAVGWRCPGCFDAPGLLQGGEACLAMLQDLRLVGLLQAAVGADAHLVSLQGTLGPAAAQPGAQR